MREIIEERSKSNLPVTLLRVPFCQCKQNVSDNLLQSRHRRNKRGLFTFSNTEPNCMVATSRRCVTHRAGSELATGACVMRYTPQIGNQSAS